MIQQSVTTGPKSIDGYWAKCNGCGVHMNEADIAYTNDDEGDEYCADCYEGIQGDDVSSGRVKPD